MKLLHIFIVAALLMASAPALASPAPAAPDGLALAPEWVQECPRCHMAMSHVNISWQAVPGASAYNVYRDGALLQSGVADTTEIDMAVLGGQTYSYAVSAVGADGVEGPQSAAQSATAASSTLISAPLNLRVHGSWQNGPADYLHWNAMPGAVSYNIYRYGILIGTAGNDHTFLVGPWMWAPGLTYTVTSVAADGTESLPSNLVTAQGANDPNAAPSWEPGLPVAPSSLTATVEWNGSTPRIHLAWHGDQMDFTYHVIRNSAHIAYGLWATNFLDVNVAPGQAYTYHITGVNYNWLTHQESPDSNSVTVTVPASAPVPATPLPAVQILRVVPNDDSAEVFFQPVPGATDYRIYDLAAPGKVKYAGVRNYQTLVQGAPTSMHYSIEWNGIDPAQGANLVVEAVDKLGPFQTMDGAMGPGAMNGMNVAINGQGDPSNVPSVLARSASFHVTPVPTVLTGDQAFFDNFRTETPLVQNLTPNAAIYAANGGIASNFTEYSNANWVMRNYQGDQLSSRLFFMGNHFMDVLYDGGTAGTSVVHNNNASMVMMPKATADISGGRVLHVTFEVDAHFSERRWCDVFVGQAGDPLLLAGKFAEDGKSPTTTGNLFRWEIKGEEHFAEMFLGGTENDVMQWANWNDEQAATRIFWDHITPLANGSMQDLDKRHHFDLYLSQTHFRIVETTPDGHYNVVHDKDFPAGMTLPFDKAQVYFVHQVYHTANDRNEQITAYPWETYWYNDRPWCDERHWDNMGQEVLTAFPPLSQ